MEESATNTKGVAEMMIALDRKAVVTKPATPQALEVGDADINATTSLSDEPTHISSSIPSNLPSVMPSIAYILPKYFAKSCTDTDPQ